MEDRREIRRRRRQRRNRVALAAASLLLLGVIVGLAGSLYYAWLVDPADTQTGTAVDLSDEHKEEYILLVSQAYAADGDWPLAQARLQALEDPNLNGTIINQLETYLRQGEPVEVVRNLAQLAEQLGAEGQALALFAPTAAVALSPTPEEANAPTATPTLLPTPTPSLEPTQTLLPTNTPIPSPTATPTTQPNYRLLSQQQRCQAQLDAPRIEVVVVDALLQEVPGVEIQVSWEEQEDNFFTGFKPEEGPGYADFEMEQGVLYTVEIVNGSLPIGGLSVEPCENGTGFQGWALEFQNTTLSQQTPAEDGEETDTNEEATNEEEG